MVELEIPTQVFVRSFTFFNDDELPFTLSGVGDDINWKNIIEKHISTYYACLGRKILLQQSSDAMERIWYGTITVMMETPVIFRRKRQKVDGRSGVKAEKLFVEAD